MIIPEEYYEEKCIHAETKKFIKMNQVGRFLKKANAYKTKGIPVIRIFIYLIELVFTKKSMYMNMLNGSFEAGFGKDVVYRFLNSTHINWSKFVLVLSISITLKMSELTSEERLNALVIDDTFFGRERSKKVELLANVYDHASKGNRYKRGFRMLTMGWTDGVTFIPLAYRHMSSENKKSRYNEINPKVDMRSCGYKTRKQAVQKETEVLLGMLEQAAGMGVPAKHVLFDSWFSFPSTIIEISKRNFSVVGRLKETKKIKYLVDGEEKTLQEIYSSNRKRRGKSKYLLSVPVTLYTKDKKKEYDQKLDAKIVFVRDKNNSKKWIAFITTDMSLSEEQVIALYGKRWSIEVFFKICKSYLNLGKEFQGISYDAITAHTAVVMTRYMILATQKRENEDPRALGEIFFGFYDEIADVQFAETLEIILSFLVESLNDMLFLSERQIDQIIDTFMSKIPQYLKRGFPAKNAS